MEKKKHFATLLVALKDESHLVDDRHLKYNALSQLLHEGLDDSQIKVIERQQVADLELLLLRDIKHNNIQVSQSALQSLGLCLHLPHFVDNLSDASAVLSQLCDLIVNTTDKICCTRGLWCIGKQTLPGHIMKKQLSTVLDAIEQGQCKKNFQSLTIEYEALCATIRLLQQVPDEMEAFAPRWGKLVYPLVLHDAPKIRQQAMLAMEIGLESMIKHRDEILRFLLTDLKPDSQSDHKSKSLLVSQMVRLMGNKLELHVLKVWSLYVRLLGKAIHHGSLINTLLPIVEQGFKNSLPEVKVAAYQTWKELINNFALNKDIISDQKRVKLLMQVFRINNAKHENVALAKLDVWWHFVRALRESASLNFDTVCLSLLQYSISGVILPASSTPGKTPTRAAIVSSGFRSPLTPGLSSSPNTFLAVQHKGCEILGHVLGKPISDTNNLAPVYTTAVPETDIITGVAFFVKHHAGIFDVVQQCILTLGDQIEDSLLRHIWFAVIAHVKNVIQCAAKHDSVDTLQCLMRVFQDIVHGQALSPDKILKLLEGILCLPGPALSSSSYSVGGTTSAGSTIMQGNAATFLMRCLFHHRMLETALDNPLFQTLYDKLVEYLFSHETSGLISAENIIDLLSSSESNIEKPDSLAKFWISLATELNQNIVKTGEVNQGGGHEYDFTCLLDVLSFPIGDLLTSKVAHGVHTSLVKTWSKLFGSFGRLAALVSTAPENCICEQLCHKLLPSVCLPNLQDEAFLNAMSQILVAILEAFEFSALSDQSHFGFGFGQSPSKFGHKKQSSLQTLNSFVKVLEKVLYAAMEQTAVSDISKTEEKRSKGSGLNSTILNLIQILCQLFNHVPNSSMLASLVNHLAIPISKLIDAIGRKNRTSITQITGQKTERLWQDIATSIQSRYNGPCDTDFLSKMSPLYEVTFLHPKQKIKSQALTLWNATFARSPPLVYPEDLKPVLSKVKDRSAILLPGFDLANIGSTSETPNSMMSQLESQVAFPDIVGLRASPHKQAASFLNRVVPPSIKSPLKPPEPTPSAPKSPAAKSPHKAKLKLSINDLRDDDFVVIKNSPNKKHILTAHQKEVLKARSTIPALYSNVDASQDLSLMAKFISNESQSQMSSISSTPTTTPICELTPFLFSKDATKHVNGEKSEKLSEDVFVQPKEKKISRRRSVRFASDATEKENISDDNSPKTVIEIEDSEKNLSTKESARNSITISDSEPMDVSDDPKDVQIIDVFSAGSQFAKAFEADPAEEKLTESPRHSKRKGKNTDEQNIPSDAKSRQFASNLLDNISEETVADKQLNKQTFTILAEESQQVSPSKPKNNSLARVAVLETPVKEDTSAQIGDLKFCSQNLFEQDDSIVIPDSQAPNSDLSKLISHSGTQKNEYSQSELNEMMAGSCPFEEVKTEVDVTPPCSRQPRLNSVALSPVVSVQRLSEEELLAYSPKMNGTSRLLECVGESELTTSQRKNRKSRSKREEVASSFERLSRSSSMESMSQEIPSSQRTTRKTCIDKSAQNFIKSEVSMPTNKKVPSLHSVTEVENDSVFIVEMHSTEKVVKENIMHKSADNDSDCSNADLSQLERKPSCSPSSNNNISHAAENPDIEPMEFDSMDDSQKRTGRNRKTPQWMKDMELTDSGKKRKTVAEGKNDNRESRKSRRSISQACSIPSSNEKNEDFVLLKNPTLNDDFSDILGDTSGKELQKSENLSQNSKRASLKIETDSECEADSQTQDMANATLPEGQTEPDPTSSANKLESSDEEILANVRKTLRATDETLLETNSLNSQESLGFDLTGDQDLVQTSGSCEDMNVLDTSEDEPLANCKKSSSTMRVMERITRRSRKASPKSQKNTLKSALRSSTSKNSRTQSRTRSVSASKRSMQLQKKVRNRRKSAEEMTDSLESNENHISSDINDVESALVDQVQEAGEMIHSGGKAEMEPEMAILNESESNVIENDEDHEVDMIPEEIPEPFKSESKEISSQESASNDLQPKIDKFVSPLRSPPRRGKLFTPVETKSREVKVFSMPETPPSHKKHPLLSRASLILQRAKVAKTPEPLQHGRGPLAAGRSTSGGRPGILKSPNTQSPNRPGASKVQRNSPPNSFRTIHLPRIHSPSASPSAGILRKRKLSDETSTDSPSPPSKQRRVCFDDNIQTREIPSAQKVKLKARMVGRGSPKPVNRCLDMPNGSLPPSPLVDRLESSTTNKEDKFITRSLPKGRILDMKPLVDSEMSETQNSIQISPESQLDCRNPVCPQYVTSELPIEHVLPLLTSSTWSAGLGQLMRSMNITTIGKLCSLTEQEVHNLPIKSPKVATLRQVINSVMTALKPVDKADTEDENPLVEVDKLADISPSEDPSIVRTATEVCDPDDNSHDLLDEIRLLDSSMKSTPPSSPEPEIPPRKPTNNIFTEIMNLKCNQESLGGLGSSQLMQLVAQLNSMTTEAVEALKTKCPTSPNSSQS